ncbi:MAG TPA: OmpH family outer membrane protein [Stellaceae bacterium]|jgi:Skp family chaperone for outer membrane proteins
MSFWSARVLSCAVILGVCAALSPPPARAAEKTAALVPAVLTVDLAQVLRGSKAGKGVQTALSQESTNYSKEVARQEDELQRMRSDLERQRTVLSPTAFDAKAKAFQSHLKELDAAVQAKRQAMQKAYNDAMTKIEQVTRDIIAQLAKERGANLVVLKQAVVLSPESSDITNEVLERLDKSLASVPISLPKTGELPAPRTSSRRERPRSGAAPVQLPDPQKQPAQLNLEPQQ